MNRAARLLDATSSSAISRLPIFAWAAAVLLAACTGSTTMDGSVSDGGRDVPFDAPSHDVPRCSTNTDCVGDPGGAACDTTSGRCVECIASNDVCPPAQHCDDTLHQCVSGCRSDLGCMRRDGGVLPDGGAFEIGRCDTSTHSCVECLGAGDCPSGTVCTGHMCAVGCSATEPCATGSDCCSGGCVDVSSNVANCGACGRACAPAHATAACSSGQCAIGTCDAGFGDCDGDASNGCETDLSTATAHCGACANACGPGAHGVAACVMGACALGCDVGFADCDLVASNGCEVELATDVVHCGTCGTACAATPNATPTCTASTCGFVCNAGFDDCDSNAANGCEVALANAPAHCGACGNACPTAPNAAPTCSASTCGIVCNAGFGDCDTMASNGCETSLTNSATNCGACGTTCSAPSNAAALCISGSCAFACLPGFADCNTSPGCETDVRTNANACGACGTTCPSATNATASCVNGTCGVTCTPGFGDCDAIATNGCETALSSDNANCGGCGTACASGSVCVTGSCQSGLTLGFGGFGADRGNGVATDASGNIYVVGGFSGSSNFGGGVLTSAGGNDVLLASYTADGTYRWSRRLGGTNTDVSVRIAVDALGNVYVVGSFAGTGDFGTGPLVSAGSDDIFVASFASDGTPRWSQRFGSASSEQANALVADVSGGIAFAGFFNGSVDFGTGTLVSAGLNDLAVVSMAADGTRRWARRYGSTGSETAYGIGEDPSGDVYVIGSFSGTGDFGGGSVSSVGGQDVFVARYESTTGAYMWSRRFGSSGSDNAFDVAFDSAGNSYVVGAYSGAIDFGTGSLAFAGGQDAYVMSMSSSGTTRWATRIGGAGTEFAYRTAVASSGEVAVAGYFSGTSDFGTGSISAGTGTAGFVATYVSTTGAARWVRSFGSGGTVNFNGLCNDRRGGSVVTGSFTGTQTFSGTTITSTGGDDMLLMTVYP